GACGLLVLQLRDAEEHHRSDAAPGKSLDLVQQHGDVEAGHPGQRLVRERLGRDEERQDELVEREPGLAHEPAQGSRTAEAPQPGDRERAHARMVRTKPRIRGAVTRVGAALAALVLGAGLAAAGTSASAKPARPWFNWLHMTNAR